MINDDDKPETNIEPEEQNLSDFEEKLILLVIGIFLEFIVGTLLILIENSLN